MFCLISQGCAILKLVSKYFGHDKYEITVKTYRSILAGFAAPGLVIAVTAFKPKPTTAKLTVDEHA